MGPVCQHDPLTNDIAAALGRRPGPANHWSASWIDLELGVAYAAAGQTGQAIPLLKQSLVVAGEFDHPLTAMGLLELGRIALDAGDFPEASKSFEEATYAAAEFNDYTTLEEAFRYGEQAHLMSGQPGVFPPLAAAITWARNKDRELHGSLLLSAAENNALLNQTTAAAAALATQRVRWAPGRWARLARPRRGCTTSPLSWISRWERQRPGIRRSSKRSISSAKPRNGCFKSAWPTISSRGTMGRISMRIGRSTFMRGCLAIRRRPTGRRVRSSRWPCLSTPHSAVYEHWFENTLDSGMELGLEVADRTRRHRFFSTLPLGGRLLSLRWVLESPIAGLDKQSQLERQSLLTKFPEV